ncbi:unnamed protein product [Moneuplotes crassus]|uniref:JmjC domain-containing protein n=1 Tax=Euplotes crassus TaxID=5936 RepID=A0AAD1UJE4_EUPCR|nr:unnamed protein product [Moneuplotes crassus]
MDPEELAKISNMPVFRPTKKEFKNFSSCIEKYVKLAGNSGWKPRKEGYENLDLTVQHPIEQNVWGSNGVYELLYMLRESRSLDKYRKLVSKTEHSATKKTHAEIEKLFWKTLKLNAPLYGADIEGSLMDKGTPWNLAELDTCLKDGLDTLQLSGVNNPYIYIGGWKTMFGWHKEDLDLYSINYLHFGAPKYWYSIDLDSNSDFEGLARKTFTERFEKCSEYLRHKNTLVHPVFLKKKGIKIRKIVQKPGEFVVLRATAYHCGFNSGFNIAEAVNFALFDWIERVASGVKFCNCIKDSVKINMSSFCQTLIDKFKKTRSSKKKAMIKTLMKVQDEDIKMKEMFKKKEEFLAEKKAKALQNRRNTIKRRNRKRCAASQRTTSKSKRVRRLES